MKFSQLTLVISCLLMATGLVLETLASHLSDAVLINTFHRDMLRLAANITLFNALGASILSIIISGQFINTHTKLLKISCIMLLTGTVIFTLSVLCVALGIVPHAPTAPIGGSLQIIAWVLAGISFIKKA